MESARSRRNVCLIRAGRCDSGVSPTRRQDEQSKNKEQDCQHIVKMGMSNKSFGLHVLFVVHMSLAVAMPTLAVEYKNYTDYPEWQVLLTLSGDGMDLEERARFRRLIDRGEAAHEAMLAVLWQCNDWYYASGAMEMLHCSQGDKTKVWPELRRLLAARLPEADGDLGDDQTACCRSIARMLAENGSAEDVEALIPVLTHSNALLRSEAALYLGQYGGENALEILEAAKDQIQMPVARQNIESVMATIENRLAKGQGTLEQGKAGDGETE